MSGILDSYQDSTDQVLEVMAARPLEAEKPKPKHSGWSTVPRAVAAGVAEVGANLADIAGAYGQTAAIQYAGNPLVGEKAQQQASEAYERLTTEGIDWRSPASKPAYEFSRELRPDPLTAGTAENIVFGLTKGLTKAIGSAAVLGVAGGATVFGASEGMTAAEDLAEQGVDKATRTKVGLVTGAVNTASIALPVAGQTLKQTVGLVAVGGPLAFMGQQQATRSILENADYVELAEQYDPLDPVGLAVSTLLPAGFAAYAKRGGFMPVAKPVATETPGAVIETAQPVGPMKPTPEQMDAVMVHNLTAARDAQETIDPAFIKAIDEASPPEVAELAPAPIDAAAPIDAPAKAAEAPQDQATPFITEAPTVADRITLNRNALEQMKNETGWAETGGRILRDATTGDVTGRTQWIPRYEWWVGRPDSLNEKATQAAIDKALTGGKLNAKETRMVNYLLDVADHYRKAEDYLPTPDELATVDLAPADALETAMLARAIELDADAVDRLAMMHENDDSGAFMASVKEMLDGYDQNTKTDGGGQDGAQAKAGETAPDLPVEVTDDGTLITAAQKLDDARKLAQEGTDTELGALDAPLLKVAAECFLSGA